MITNEDKKPLKEMEPEEIGLILKAEMSGRQYYAFDNEVKEWIDDNDIAIHPGCIYRQKPKRLSPNELYEAVEELQAYGAYSDKVVIKAGASATQYKPLWKADEVLELIKQLEGYEE